ncbi:MAG: glycoside hydrolase family 3 N-terminal domain-containing protein [Thermodesulfobacteriota bacterium]
MDVNAMSLDRLAGHYLMVGFDGVSLNDQIKEYLAEFRAGGVILFSRNIEGPEQVAGLCRDMREYAALHGTEDLIIAVDQEGGKVARLKPPGFTAFAGPSVISTIEESAAFGRAIAADVQRAGFTMDMAPVADVAPEGFASVMDGRMFPGTPEQAGELCAAFIAAMQKQGVMAVAKHFPGLGRTTLDSHLDLPFCQAAASEMRESDLVPFSAAVEAGVSGVMLSHAVYTELDPDWPASISTAIARDILRHELLFGGIAMTDDLDMGAVNGRFSVEICMQRVIEAEIDLALICHPGPSVERAFLKTLQILQDDPDMLALARKSALRTGKIKQRFTGGSR